MEVAELRLVLDIHQHAACAGGSSEGPRRTRFQPRNKKHGEVSQPLVIRHLTVEHGDRLNAGSFNQLEPALETVSGTHNSDADNGRIENNR